jgi:SAM-dependent methyltransferase
MSMDLPFTGERFVPGITGNIFLEHMHRYVLTARIVAGKDVLDIASGEGFGSSMLAVQARSVIGVDISEDVITHAQNKYSSPRLNFRVGSATAIPLPDASVDVVVSFETIEHIIGHEEMLAEVKRVLRPGGVLVMSTPDKATYSDAPGYVNPFHVRELYRDQFQALLSSQFAHVRMHGQKVGFGSMIVAEDAAGQFAETDSLTMQTVSGLATPLYLVGIASDDPAAAVALQGLFSQDIQSSEPALVRVKYKLEQSLARLDQEARGVLPITVSDVLMPKTAGEAALAEAFKWMSSEIASLQSDNWMSRASLIKLLHRIIKVRLLYALSRSKLFSERRRVKFLRSAEKRDPVLFSARLDRLYGAYLALYEVIINHRN